MPEGGFKIPHVVSITSGHRRGDPGSAQNGSDTLSELGRQVSKFLLSLGTAQTRGESGQIGY